MSLRISAPLLLIALSLAASATPSYAQKRSLDHDAYAIWNRIDARAIADDGAFLSVTYGPEDGEPVTDFHNLRGNGTLHVDRGTGAVFVGGRRWAALKIIPPKEMTRAAKLDGKKKDELPPDSLAIIDLQTGSQVRLGRLKSFKASKRNAPVIAYLLGSVTDSTASDSADATPTDDKKKNRKGGATLVIANLAADREWRFENVGDYTISENGTAVAFSRSEADSVSNGVYSVRTATGAIARLLNAQGSFKQLAVSEAGDQIAFLHDVTPKDDIPSAALYWASSIDGPAELLAKLATPGIPEGWIVNTNGSVEFSKSGHRLFFGTSPVPALPDTTVKQLDDEKVVVDVWNWKDPLLQTEQLVDLDADRKRTYRAVIILSERSHLVHQLAEPDWPTLSIPSDGDARYGIANSNIPYRPETSWDFPDYFDISVVDVATGDRSLVKKRVQSSGAISPSQKYVTWWDRDNLTWMAQDLRSGKSIDLGKEIAHPLQNELHDWPYGANPYGNAGWTDDDRFLVYDKHDIYSVDPTGRTQPVSLTGGQGRATNKRYRYVRLNPDEKSISETDTLLLSVFNLDNRSAGFASVIAGRPSSLRLLVESEHAYSTPTKARDADVVSFTRESFSEFPNIWTASTMMRSERQVTDLNPQQSEYLWGTAELVHWTSTDGVPLSGLLYKPEDFDPGRQYPMMVYFYEKNSDLLYRHHAPEPHRSTINITFYVSRGYVVFVPDIVYKVGYPGESAMASVMPGVTSLIDKGYIDAARVGVQGHSWGGYQIAYMVTRTNLFRAAEAGAPVANMVSAYGGIRWGTGKSRMFQYERTQSRIGGSLWEYPMRYLENSPIFRADDIETPLLIMHNDHDAAVPWYQGIELFVALRRLGKPAWMINYNGEPHWPTRYNNKKDWTIRMQQFFDYYLKDAPPPIWLSRGVPAMQKGLTLGLEADSTAVDSSPHPADRN